MAFDPGQENDPRYHVRNVTGMLDGMIQHLREDIRKFDEPRAQALFETSAEVLEGLRAAFQHYLQGKEQGWRD